MPQATTLILALLVLAMISGATGVCILAGVGWMLMFVVSAACLWWLHSVVTRIVTKGAPHLAESFEHKH